MHTIIFKRLSMVQEFINKQFYTLYFISLFLGLILCYIIRVDFIDELCSILLFILFIFSVFKTPNWSINKTFLFTLCVFGFYLIYSLLIKSNAPKSIFADFIIQMKPYMAFFCTYQLKPSFNDSQKNILKQCCLLFWFILLVLGIADIIIPYTIIEIMQHPTFYASAVTGISLTYFYLGNYTFKERIIFLLMLSIGIISGRSKFYGFYAAAAFVTLYFGNPKNLAINTKNILAIIIMLCTIFFVAREKIIFYFFQNFTEGGNDGAEDYIARFVLYKTSFEIIQDYIPFGSGLGSFATHASRICYSPIYTEYGINNVWGLSKSFDSFIADTYYPSLAQFGITGVLLYISFWLYAIKKAFQSFRKTGQTHLIIIVLLICGFLFIENVADATFTSNRGFFMMLLLGFVLSNQKETDMIYNDMDFAIAQKKESD